MPEGLGELSDDPVPSFLSGGTDSFSICNGRLPAVTSTSSSHREPKRLGVPPRLRLTRNVPKRDAKGSEAVRRLEAH